MKIGIYFFLKRKKVVYVGKTKNFPARFWHSHFRDVIDFDTIRFIECNLDKCIIYERRWIKKFNPVYNTVHTERHRKSLIGKPIVCKYFLKKSSKLDLLEVGKYVYTTRKDPWTQISYLNRTRLNKKFVVQSIDGQHTILRIL